MNTQYDLGTTVGSKPPCLLVVDDLPGHLGGLLDFLHAVGYEVAVATSGEHALTRLELALPDLILLDVNMPGVDGYETCRRLKTDARWREIPVLFLTAQSDPADKVRAFAAGAVDFVTKPLHNEEVLARVQAHLQIRSLQRSLEDQNALLREAEAQLQASLESAVVIVAGRDTISFCTHLARQLLSRYFPSHGKPHRLPSALVEWAQSNAAREPWSLQQGEARLEVRRFAEGQPGRTWLLTLEETQQSTDSPTSLLRLGLTARESEVLFWVAKGKSNPEVALILEAALNTVKCHVQNILAKLGVESRLAAALRANEILEARDALASEPRTSEK